jgi:putative ABC transport system permease protein
MLILHLALKSLRNRALTTVLTLASIALSVTLLVGVENVRAGVRESFSGTIRGTDLIVGARGGTLQLLLSSVFGIGQPAGSVDWATYQRWAAHPAVRWTIPISLGDSHRGFRVIGTSDAFFEHFRFRRDQQVTLAAGERFADEHDVVIGAEVAERLGYAVGDSVIIAHGLADIGASDHEQHPFVISGIIARTFTPIDRAVYVTLEGIEAMHEEPGEAGPPAMPGAMPPAMPGATPPAMPGASPPPVLAMPGAEPPPGAFDFLQGEAVPGQPQLISAFFVGTKNRMESLNVQREINTDRAEPLTAVIPGVALAELWQGIGNAEIGLKVVAGFTVLIGLTGMLVALYSSLESRRREMAILRAVGAGPRTIVSLLVLESGVLAALGSAIGIALVYLSLVLAQGPVEQRFGLYVPIRPLGATEWTYVAVVVVAGFLVGVIPALKAYRTSLVDGLSPRV